MKITVPSQTTKIKRIAFQLTLLMLLFYGYNAQAQGPYQYYSGGNPTQMGNDGWVNYANLGNWVFTTANNAGAQAARSGTYCVTQAGTNTTLPISFQSPKINTPQTFSYWAKATTAAITTSITFSDDNGATWNTVNNGAATLSTVAHPTPFSVSSAVIPTLSTSWQLVTVTAAFPASVNGYYFRISDTRPNGTAGTLSLDDFSWTSSVATDNTIIVPLVNPVAGTPSNATISVPTTAVYHFFDVGGIDDYYSRGQTNNVVFTPATAGDKIKITFIATNFATANANNKVSVFDFTNTSGTNSILGSPCSGSSPTISSYVSSLSSNGSIAIQFISNGTYGATGIGQMADGFDIKVECSSPVCQLPTSTPTISNIGSTTATISWTGISSGYEFAANTTSPATAPTVAGTYTTSTTGSLTGLTPNTFYYGWVRSKCAAGFYSAWVQTTGFTTACPPNSVPYTENFTGWSFILPTCTSQDVTGDWQTDLTNGNLFATIAGNFFYTQPVTLATATTYKLSYDYSALSGTASFDVYYGTVNDVSMMVPANKLASHVNISALTSKTLNFTVPTNGAYYIGFYLVSTSTPSTTKLVLDNINVDCISPVITASTTAVCDSNTIITLTGSGTSGFTWATSAGNLYSNSAGTIPYVALTNATTVYFRTSSNATITVTGINGACSKTATQSITIKSTTWTTSGWSNGAPDSATQAIFNGNYTSSGDLNACSVIVTSGTILFKTGNSLIVQNAVNVNGGSLTFENNASLVQVNNVTNGVGVYNGGNTGNITYLRDTTPMNRYDYTYWSSPVNPQTLVGLSPQTLSDKYYYYNASGNSWAGVASSSIMNIGQGYIIRAPQTFDLSFTQVYHASFVGVPNSGSITTPIAGPGNLNLIGNPYPSALNADSFLSYASNSGVVDATIYLWTHNTPITNSVYSANDYAVYNYLGGTGTTAAPSGATGGFNNNVPNGKIAAGQSFFIKGLANGNATFQNSMRVVGYNSQFFKTANSNHNQNSNTSRIWLDVSDSNGGYKQTLIGYAQQATTGIDRGYDGEYYNFGTSVSLYSLVGTTTLAIQGRPLPFDNSDEVPLGFNATTTGTFTINLYNFDGLFNNQNIYLKDVLLNTIVNLKNGSYSFSSKSGTFNDRFVLVYRDRNRANNNDSDKKNDAPFLNNVIIYKPNDELHIDAGTTVMQNIKVFDLRGSLLFQKTDINNTTTTLNIGTSNQVLLIEITTAEGEVVTKKYIN